MTSNSFWRELVAEQFNVRSISDRQFTSLCGLTIPEISYVWETYCVDTPKYLPNLQPKSEKHLLMMLNFIKDYSVEDNLSLYWSISKPTFRARTQETLLFLSLNMNEVRYQ
jgi:hypothetical protein